MSDALSTHDDSPHEGPIKTPKQLILAVIFSFVVPIFGIVLLVMYVTRDLAPPPGSDGLFDPSRARQPDTCLGTA